MAWIDEWGAPVDLRDLAQPTARSFVKYVETAASAVVSIAGAHRNEHGAEIVIVEMQTGAPQRPVAPIRRVEPLGLVFAGGGSMPLVLALREDFPDTEHQQLVPEGCPAAICIDDRPWDEARLTWTPAEMTQRIAAWYWRAARGDLHDPNQPLDPFFGLSRYSFVFPRAAFEAEPGSVELAGLINESGDDARVVITTPLARLKPEARKVRILPLAYRVQPECMTRMRKAPRSLGSLMRFLDGRGVDLLADLRTRIRGWTGTNAESGLRLGSQLAIIVDMPVIAPNGTQPGTSDVRAFVSVSTVGEIGVALGVLHSVPRDAVKSGFCRAIPEGAVDDGRLDALVLEFAQVHVEFDADRAAVLSGRDRVDARKAMLVGAGALGSHLAEFLARQGRFRWTIVDDDRLLPHNLARHTLQAIDIGRPKAQALAARLNAIFSPDERLVAPTALVCNVLHPGDKADVLRAAFADADVVIDASASVAAARSIADQYGAARRASAFFNPSGEAAVVLVEDHARSITLRDVEAQYYRAVLREPALEKHFTAIADRFAYTGACRAVTSRIPESRVALLAAHAAEGLSQVLDTPNACIAVWSVSATGEVTLTKPSVAAIERHAILNWEVSIDTSLKNDLISQRAAKVPNETGGVLLGIVDAYARKVLLVEALAAPPDSLETPFLFERGIAGLTDEVTAMMARTMDQVRYVGEWHSHPPRYSVQPSGTDLIQLSWLARVASMEELPALMVIVGDHELNVGVGEARPVCS
ncbi:ThiF family adenylyltransferase [Prosthecodimorpha staleyi]|uniref:ThiF family adenylyltransferase n=1 Tax=Prosthecodimorpha staleyi TaxID=2840188 RepID=A0A947GGZ6_9HYPH|nr:ThiF family adenylyltransferase [Prosthecodimorpha staleyi]MBT9293090.1 ThiF family adenylyltransferase [Prosthecodimorpha staleyi]